jgi:predicted AAA+ superfamily ATPase
LSKLLQALAFQAGSEVSYHELALLLKDDHTTILRYSDLLEESNKIFSLSPLSVNH